MTEPTANVLQCPKCRGTMRTYERNGVHVEQCETCRGIFLDFGELEALTRLEAQLAAPPPPTQAYPPQQAQPYPPQYPPQPGWGGHGYGHGRGRRRGFGSLFYSS
jgi:Zn-finger nucleic acid-binding protein